jgi:glycosyltransferase involved in cell wall biosynthesis
MSATCPDLVVLGPPGHGVRGYAADLAAAVQELHPSARVLDVPDSSALVRLAARGRPLHVHVTDHLLAGSPAQAADVLEAVSARCELSVTLHDVPQPSDGPGRLDRRAAGYRRMARAARRVVVSSEHERALLHDHLGADVASAARVVPLGSAHATAPAKAPAAAPEPETHRVLVAGWVYPGKGHLEAARAAVRAAADLPGRPGEVRVVAIGGASPGHEAELDGLRAAVREVGAHLEVTGVLDREAYRAQLTGHGVPVVAHQHVSASRTLLEWAEHGRRAIVLRSRYSEEMAALRPGLIDAIDPARLAEAIGAAWLDPGSTWLPPSTDLRPDLVDAARAYLSVWRTS